MPLLGQASGGWTESSSSLRILHVGVRNTVGVLTDDAFLQTNPPIVGFGADYTQVMGLDTDLLGVLSGSVALTRPDQGDNMIGGPIAAANAAAGQDEMSRPVGVFLNHANGNSYENTPGTSSGKGPYVSAQGTYANGLFEFELPVAVVAGGGAAIGLDLTYTAGMGLVCSVNGYLMPEHVLTGGAFIDVNVDNAAAGPTYEIGAVSGAGANTAFGRCTRIGVVKMPSDATQAELVYDQRI